MKFVVYREVFDETICSWLLQGEFSLVIETKAPYDGAHGSVAERFNAPVLKTDEGLYPSVSSNLTASAKF